MQRNVILDTAHGTGIYLDYANANCRITSNVVANTGSFHGPGPGIGGVYVEASQEPNWIDHNLIWNSSRANGIYGFSCSNLTVAHNLVGHCAGAGIMLLDVPGRPAGNPGGGNRVLNNVLVENGWHLTVRTARNASDYNLLGCVRQASPWRIGDPEKKVELEEWRREWRMDVQSRPTQVNIAFHPDTLELSWSAPVDMLACPPVPGIGEDFWGRPRTGQTTFPGPFGSVFGEANKLIADPRVEWPK